MFIKERRGPASKADTSMLNRALNLASVSTCRMKHGAVLVLAGRVVAVGVNRNRNQPYNVYPEGSFSTHAEMAALRAVDYQAKGMKMYIARLAKAGPSLSRPCADCYKALLLAGVKEIIYT